MTTGGGGESVSPLSVVAAGINFQNPVLLAAGTAAYGREIAEVTPLEEVGGLVTKAVSLEPRKGAPSPRVTTFDGGMLNAIGLANPGVEAVVAEELPWIAAHLRRCRVLVNVVGYEIEQFAAVVARLEGATGFQGYELNLSCPNVKAGGMEFGADPVALAKVVSLARAETRRPIFVKLSPVLADIATAARIAVDAGADGISVVNTMPGLLVDVKNRRPELGFGSGGMSGTALRPVGLLATWRVSQAVPNPVVGIGGISCGEHVVQYLMAGASLVAIGTASLRDPRAALRIVAELGQWLRENGIRSVGDIVGTLEWPSK